MTPDTLTADPGSFRDPAGRVYIAEDRVYRTVTPAGAASFETVLSSGILDRMAASGHLIASETVLPSAYGFAEETAFVLAHPKVPVVTYPYEWSFEGLRAAALAHLDLHLALLEEGFTLSDASAFNIQFFGPQARHIDVLSIIPYNDGDHWTGYDQFKRQFLNPLLLEADTAVSFAPWYRGSLDGITSDEVLRMLPWRARLSPARLVHVVAPALYDRKARDRPPTAERADIPGLPKKRMVSLLDHLVRIIRGLRGSTSRKTVWSDYTTENSYSDEDSDRKADVIARFVTATKPDLLIDAGCNTGAYAEIATHAGARRIIGLETDRSALDLAFRRASEQGLDFLPLCIDLANPSPGQGWQGQERQPLVDRLCADGLLALALIHHLVIANNIPLDRVIAFLVSLAPTGLIEFVPKADPQVQRMLRFRKDIFADYTSETFERLLTGHVRILSAETVTDSGRTIFRYER